MEIRYYCSILVLIPRSHQSKFGNYLSLYCQCSIRARHRQTMSHSTFPRSGVLVLGSASIQSLLPATLISQVESLLEGHRIDDAITLVEQQGKKLQGKITVDEDEVRKSQACC